MADPSRRTALTQLGSLTALLGTLLHPACARAYNGPASKELPDWVKKTDQLTALFRQQELSIQDWRAGLDELFNQVSLEELLKDTDFTQIKEQIGYAQKGVTTATIRFETGPRRLTFYPKIFALGKDRAIIPHGHENMVSAHLILSGRLQLRQYDQLSRKDKTMTVRPTIDREISAGELSSIGAKSDNVHWFIATEPAHTFDMIVTGLDPQANKNFDIFNLDMDNARLETNGEMKVPIIDVNTALAKYG